MTALDVATPLGPARATCEVPDGDPVGRLLLGHGAGGGIEAPDLLLARDTALALGWAVARVEQPWRVAGRKVAVLPPKLDVGWLAVAAALAEDGGPAFAAGTPLVLGGRSAGARVACRTSGTLVADGVLCLAFPLHPPGSPDKSRAFELPTDRPVLVVQGATDPFGSPTDVRTAAPSNVQVVPVRGDHSLKSDRPGLRAAVTDFLGTYLRA